MELEKNEVNIRTLEEPNSKGAAPPLCRDVKGLPPAWSAFRGPVVF